MATRKRITVSEGQVALQWQQLLGKILTTEQGERLKLVYPGRINGGNGPDFLDAVILTNQSNLLKGDVEVHVKSSDWYSHGHHRDPGYNRVVLHVVAQRDTASATLTQNGQTVPVLCLPPDSRLKTDYHLPCFQIARQRDRQTLKELLSIAGGARFRQKAGSFQFELHRGEAKQVLWKGMMRALGYSKNMKPFEELACRVPLSFLEEVESGESLLLRQAWLLGVAGLFPHQRTGAKSAQEKETRELEQTWQAIGKEIEAMSQTDWYLSHIYPNNFPVRRIIAQSYFLQRYHRDGLLQGILQLVRETSMTLGHRWLEDGLTVPGEGYWQDHHDFGLKTKKSALLGHSKAGEIIANVILPLAFAWGEVANEPELKERAISLYSSYPKLDENEITRHMARQLCLESTSDFTASHQQGLIHLFKNYCSQGKCSQCLLVNQGSGWGLRPDHSHSPGHSGNDSSRRQLP